MITRVVAVTLGIAAVAAATACSPASPSPPVTTNLSIKGSTKLQQPGDTSQLAAIVTLKDGTTTMDVTSQAEWSGGTRSIDGERVVSVTRGVVSALDYGEAVVTATYLTARVEVTVRVVPDGTFLVSGWVREGAFGLPEVRVAAVSSGGTSLTMTTSGGYYVVPGGGDVTLQVQKEGYHPEVRQVTVNSDVRADFSLQPISAAGSLGGIWKLTMVASPSCTLPPEAMQRQYTANLREAGNGVTVELGGGTPYPAAGTWGFTGTRTGNAVRFVLDSEPGSPYFALEQLNGSRFVGYLGTAVGTAADTSMVAIFNGSVEIKEDWGFYWRMVQECSATDHKLLFVR